MVADKLNLAILISGRGSNMMSLLDACEAPDFPARAALVVSDNPDAPGLQKAQDKGVQTVALDARQFKNKAAFESALHDALKAQPVDLICLAGFMRLLSADFLERWPARVINIHPSLLPAYKGLDTHERVIADGAGESGCSVHFVTAGMDEGPVIMQARVPVHADDTPETLAARVLDAEHRIYPDVVRLFGEKRVNFIDGRAEIVEISEN